MKAQGLGITPLRRIVCTTDSGHDQPVFPNLYRTVIPSRPNQGWVGDITYIPLSVGFCYLAVMLDACSRKAVGYALSRSIDTQLTLAALTAAARSRRAPVGCIHHTDLGSQYASEPHRHALAEFGLRGSMSAPANLHEKAQTESFMKTLKVEQVCLEGYETFDDVATQPLRFIEDIYTAKRIHSALGYVSRNEFEDNFAQQAAWFR